MAFKGQGFETQQVITAAADADLSAAQGHCVKLTATGCALNGAGAAAAACGVGILINKPDAIGKLASICVHGKVPGFVDATTAILAGDHLTSDGSGHLIKTTTLANNCIAIALEPKASGTGLIKVLVQYHSI